VSVADLQFEKQTKELKRFETENTVHNEKNHLTGTLEAIHIDAGKFHE
jgi:hypothetical protein